MYNGGKKLYCYRCIDCEDCNTNCKTCNKYDDIPLLFKKLPYCNNC